MKGLGTDERRITQVLVSHNNDQRQEIAAKYKQMYGEDLVKQLKSELSGCFEDAVLALLIPSRKYDAINVRKAVKGLGTDEKMLIEILCPRTNADIDVIKQEYKLLYEADVSKVVESELSGDFKRVIVAQLEGNREETDIDMEKVEKDAQDLYDAGEAIVGTDESVFNKVLCMRSFPHMAEVFERYKTVAGKSISDSIKSETSGLFQESLLAIVDCTIDLPAFYAERLHKTMAGAGTDDDQLIRLLVSHSETDLADIKEAYFKKYDKSLRQMISEDTSGDYKRLLCAIVEGNVTPP
ncbi:hypothetical protein EB796_004566 [Bugula neritina]|nr:hypothetical protein EB796_004566 [Bugula neritina]